MTPKAEGRRALRARRRMLGLCVDCGQPAPKFTLCDACRERHNAARRRGRRLGPSHRRRARTPKAPAGSVIQRELAGLCLRCDEPVKEPGDRFCRAHWQAPKRPEEA